MPTHWASAQVEVAGGATFAVRADQTIGLLIGQGMLDLGDNTLTLSATDNLDAFLGQITGSGEGTVEDTSGGTVVLHREDPVYNGGPIDTTWEVDHASDITASTIDLDGGTLQLGPVSPTSDSPIGIKFASGDNYGPGGSQRYYPETPPLAAPASSPSPLAPGTTSMLPADSAPVRTAPRWR